jgi:predicted metal-binding protein
MVSTQPDGQGATVFICVSCRADSVTTDRPGRQLLDAVTARLATGMKDAVTIRPVECLSVCKRPCTVAMTGAGKWTYVVGDLDSENHADDVITAALSYRASENGIIPWRQRPQSFRRGIVSRVPPLGFSLEEPGS